MYIFNNTFHTLYVILTLNLQFIAVIRKATVKNSGEFIYFKIVLIVSKIY